MTSSPDTLGFGVRPGDVLAEKYRVERVLGVGGMGVVVAAHHTQLDTKVAIKVLLANMLGNPDSVARFAREARAAVRITSEHVARVLDVGTLDTGAPFMVMEYLEGGDLAAWLRERGPLAVEQAVEFILHACVAVAEAHGLGIIHRDLKPSNLFCIRRPDGQLSIKVLDFGISKVKGDTASSERHDVSVTKTAAVLGTPLYMSPEQMQSTKDADARSDIWALGVILYELLAGRVPFYGESATEVAVKAASKAPASLQSLRSDVPPGLEAVVLKCLEKDRADRYSNVAELALGLAEFAPLRARESVDRIAGTIHAAGLAVGALAFPRTTRASEAFESAETSAPTEQTQIPGVTMTSRQRGTVLGIALVVGLVFVAALGLMLLHKRLGPDPNSGPIPSAATPPTITTSQAPPIGSATSLLPDASPAPAVSLSEVPLNSTPIPAPASTKPVAPRRPSAHPANAADPRSPAPSPKPPSAYNPLEHL